MKSFKACYILLFFIYIFSQNHLACEVSKSVWNVVPTCFLKQKNQKLRYVFCVKPQVLNFLFKNEHTYIVGVFVKIKINLFSNHCFGEMYPF